MFKKMLLTLSVLLMAGAAVAGDADWSFYGVGHASLNMLNNGNDSQLGLTSNTSRFGFKGTVPMNEDFTAFWQFESLVDFAGNTGSDGTVVGLRNTYVGMKHATAGKLMLGRHDTPFKTLGRQVEFFPDQLGDFRATTNGWDNRLTEMIAYASPDWDGFSIFAGYQFDQGDINDKSDPAYESLTAMSAMAAYTTEQFMLGVAYEGYSSGYGDWYYNGEDNQIYGDGPAAYRFVAKYMGEKFEVGGMYQGATEHYFDGNDVQQDDSSTDMGLGAVFMPNAKWNIKGQFYTVNHWTDAVDNPNTADVDESDWNVTQMTLGVERVFTENVLCYLQWSSMSNGEGIVDDESAFDLAGGQSGFGQATSGSYDAAGKWQDPNGFSVGTVITW